ncbi:hypothetical protein VKT23_017311 [Stygiomarasmius scandens]|uniref:Uncharacterized protein n=1 Tax=Marasmiellus scandens TaxID=2682957 RepID=A0ABR1IVZ4_9AGAR
MPMAKETLENVLGNSFRRSEESVHDLGTGSSLDSQPGIIGVYNFLQVFGLISVLLVFSTAALSPRVRRATIWYIFMFGWIIWCISHLLLVGHQTGGPPARGLCTFQAALVYAGPPANACATLGILLQLYFSVRSTLKQNNSPPLWQTVMVNAAPLITYVCVFLESLLYGGLMPERVERDPTGIFCHISTPVPALTSAALVAIFSISMIIFEVITFFLLYHNWSAFRRLRTTSQGSKVSVTMIVRISIFSILPMLALGLVVKSTLEDTRLSQTNDASSNIATATLSGAAGLIFGTQQDLLLEWAFWRRLRGQSGTLSTPSLKKTEIV